MTLPYPTAEEPSPLAPLEEPMAVVFVPPARLYCPIAIPPAPLALLLSPKAKVLAAPAWLKPPMAIAPAALTLLPWPMDTELATVPVPLVSIWPPASARLEFIKSSPSTPAVMSPSFFASVSVLSYFLMSSLLAVWAVIVYLPLLADSSTLIVLLFPLSMESTVAAAP